MGPIRSKSWSFIRRRDNLSRTWIQRGRRGGVFRWERERGKILAHLCRARAWQPEKSRDRNATTMRHVLFLLERSRTSARWRAHNARHYDAGKTNLGKFPRCVKCLTSRLASGTKLRKRLNSPVPLNPSGSPINFFTIFIRRIHGKQNLYDNKNYHSMNID